MKILVLTLFFALIANCYSYAGNNSLTISYPAPSASYNKFVINTQATTTVTCNASNAGLLYFDTITNTLRMCATSGGNPVTVTTGETCFNRFSNNNVFNGCPTGYTLAPPNFGGSDSFTADTDPNCPGGTCTVYSTVCCSATAAGGGPSMVHP